MSLKCIDLYKTDERLLFSLRINYFFKYLIQNDLLKS